MRASFQQRMIRTRRNRLMVRFVCILCLLIVSVARADDDGSYNKFTVCDDSAIVVEDLSLLCDSPGTYYYGSSKYRNSQSCQGGDKAKIKIMFYIAEDLESEPYVTMLAKGYGSVSDYELHTAEALCSISSLSAKDGQDCGRAGYYYITEQFHWSDKNDNYEYSFSPKLTIGFASNPNKQVYDMGGANTKQCSGDTFTNWTKGVRKSAANTIRTFFATFGLLLGSVLALFAVGWCIMRQATSKPKEFIVDDPADEHDYHKFAMMGNNQNNLVDF